MKRAGWMIVLLTIFLVNIGLRERTYASSPAAKAYQRQIDAMAQMQSRLPIPDTEEDVKKLKASFDVNDYFKVFINLSMENGWILDYTYRIDGLGSYPIIVAYKQEAPDTVKEAKNYLSHVVIDGSKDSYFQLVALSLIGPRFALGWHANYYDTEIVCTKEAIQRILRNKDKAFYNFDREFIAKAKKVNFEPRIVLNEQGANVRLVIFTKWGGLIEKEYAVTGTLPHQVISLSEKVLAAYNCGIMF